MVKTAVVYDKWLDSFGGGEVVACWAAFILKKLGYKVTFIHGKPVSQEQVSQKLGVNLSGVDFKEVWNDETKLRKIVRGKDIFINVSFMDYSFGFAKINIYYTHFPTERYTNVKGLIFTKIIIPLVSKFIKPVEFISQINAPTIKNGQPAYKLSAKNKIAFSLLDIGTVYQIRFTLFLENFYSSILEDIKWEFKDANVIDKNINIQHNYNKIEFTFKFKPSAETVYFHLTYKKKNLHQIDDDEIFIIYPKIESEKVDKFLNKRLYEYINNRLRAGIFVNLSERINSYQVILSNSKFTSEWVSNYWKRRSQVIYPPVDMIFKKYKINQDKKKNWICSVGRFFTLGHGKKQEIMIKAFKELYDKGYKDWQLHLVGGVGKEPSSLRFVEQLKETTKGYPVFFHLSVSRKEVEEVYLKSKIYWHATGFGEDENEKPVRFEHFGIAPVEAISAGCIPVLFHGGGLIEIVKLLNLNVDRHLFNKIEELVEKTIYFTNRDQDLDWAEIFKLLGANFSVESFRKNFLKILNDS